MTVLLVAAFVGVEELREDQNGHHPPFSMACQERKKYRLSDARQFRRL